MILAKSQYPFVFLSGQIFRTFGQKFSARAFLVTYNESERSFSLGGLILPSWRYIDLILSSKLKNRINLIINNKF